MSHEAIIKFAPVFTLDRFNDPKWRPDRRMYYPGALRFLPGTEAVPLIVDHDDDREIGTVQKLHKWDWPGGPWIFASATVTAPPPWLKRGTRVSFGSKVIDRRDVSIREYQADVVALAFVEEVSVLSPSVQPAEPCAEVLSFRSIEKEPTSSPAAGPDRAVVSVTVSLTPSLTAPSRFAFAAAREKLRLSGSAFVTLHPRARPCVIASRAGSSLNATT
jgi:hypothetical protein